jgi:hypothetical protein
MDVRAVLVFVDIYRFVEWIVEEPRILSFLEFCGSQRVVVLCAWLFEEVLILLGFPDLEDGQQNSNYETIYGTDEQLVLFFFVVGDDCGSHRYR